MILKPRFEVFLLLCVSLVSVTVPAHAQFNGTPPITIGDFHERAIIFGLVAAGAVTGIGAYILVRRAPSITGCVAINPADLSLQNESDHRTYSLMGDIANIKVGDRIRVSGKRAKTATGKRNFLVVKLKKDFGPCRELQATP
jgi:hypothetical protein